MKKKELIVSCKREDCFANSEGVCSVLVSKPVGDNCCVFHKAKDQFYEERKKVFEKLITENKDYLLDKYYDELAEWEKAVIEKIKKRKRVAVNEG